MLANLIRGIVKKNPQLKLQLKKANSKLSPFQYIYQTLTLSIMSFVGVIILLFFISKNNITVLLTGICGSFLFFPFIYKFYLNAISVQVSKLGREVDSDILFVSEYLLVSLESGLPIGNAIENLSKIRRPGGVFFSRIYTEFKTGKSFDEALEEGIRFSPSKNMKNLIKKLKDSINIGVDLKSVLETYINDSSEKKILDAKAFSKKLNPIVMMYLLLGIVIPSLGVTFFILAAAMLEMTPGLLKMILFFIFLIMFGFQYFAYTIFKFNKSTI